MSPIAPIAPGAKADFKAESTLARLLGSGISCFFPYRRSYF